MPARSPYSHIIGITDFFIVLQYTTYGNSLLLWAIIWPQDILTLFGCEQQEPYICRSLAEWF